MPVAGANALHPAQFLAAMVSSMPLGFYSPSHLVQDAKRHGVEVRSVDVMCSELDSTLEDLPHPPAVRLGLGRIAKLRPAAAERIVAARRASVSTRLDAVGDPCGATTIATATQRRFAGWLPAKAQPQRSHRLLQTEPGLRRGQAWPI